MASLIDPCLGLVSITSRPFFELSSLSWTSGDQSGVREASGGGTGRLGSRHCSSLEMGWWGIAVAALWALLATPEVLPYSSPHNTRPSTWRVIPRMRPSSSSASSSSFSAAEGGNPPKWFKPKAPANVLTIAELNSLISEAKLPRDMLREITKQFMEAGAESLFSDNDLHSRARCMQLLVNINCIDQAVAMASLCFAQGKWIPLHIFDSIIRSMCSSSPVHSVLAFIDKGLSTKQLLPPHTFSHIFRICGSFNAYKAILLRMKSVSAIPSPADVLAAMRSCGKDAYSALLILDYCNDLNIPLDHDMFAQCFHSIELAGEASPHNQNQWAAVAASLWRDMTAFYAISPSVLLVERVLRLFARAQLWHAVSDALDHFHQHLPPSLFASVVELLTQEEAPREILLAFIKAHTSALQAICAPANASQTQSHATEEVLVLALKALHKCNQSHEALRLLLNATLFQSSLQSAPPIISVRPVLF